MGCGEDTAAASAISTHAPAGGATRSRRRDDHNCLRFLLTPLREGRQLGRDINPDKLRISTHAPAGGATLQFHAKQAQLAFLLTPLREGRQNNAFRYFLPFSISTHAPAGGATRRESCFRQSEYPISTHAPAGGATRSSSPARQAQIYFYSRPCGRGDDSYAVSLNFVYPFLLTPLREGRRMQ